MKKNSKKDRELKLIEQQYSIAYGTHHMGKDPVKALKLYRAFIAAYPNAKEAGYALTQIQNIERTRFSRPGPVRTPSDEKP